MKLLYWEAVNQHFTETLPLSGKVIEHERKKRLKSDHPAVEKVWVWGGFSPTKDEMFIGLEILLKSGERKSIKINSEQAETLDIPEAIEFLQSLKTTEQ